MESIRAYRFRIYPDTKRQKEIDKRIILAQQLYNTILEKAKSEYEKNRITSIGKSTLNRYMNEAINENKDFLKLYSQTRQDIFVRLQKAYQNFFRRCEEKKAGKKVKVGFPRFKSIDKYKSITYPQYNGSFRIEKIKKEDRLRVSRIGTMRIDLHRPIEGRIKTLTIKRKAGEYYAIFTAVNEITVPEVADTNPVGIDMGLNSFVALSDGTKVEKPKFARQSVKHLARWQRKLARRTKWEGDEKAKEQSKNREKAKAGLQKEWEHVASQSEDFAHKLSNKLVNLGYTSFAVEKLQIQNMVRNHNLAQAIYNASWRKFIQMLSYKAESAGLRVFAVDPKDTTQECSRCHNVKKGMERLTLNDRIYHCNVCGLTMDRDINAALVIKNRMEMLKRATVGQTGSNASGDAASTIQRVSQVVSMNQEHTLQPFVAGEAHDL
jgi:putative transposase